MQDTRAGETFRFGQFELNLQTYELRREGRTVRLERLPMDLLIMLVARRGDLVTRADINDRLWGKDVFIDVETGVHTAIRKIRQALRDSAEAPSFIETVSGRGYRFVAPVEIVTSGSGAPTSAPAGSAEQAAGGATRVSLRRTGALIAGALVLVVMAAFAVWNRTSAVKPPARVILAVLPFENIGGVPERGYLADGLTEETIAIRRW